MALGWNIGKEDILSDNTAINNLKLRASWGQTGNQEGIDNKVTLASFTDSKADNDTYALTPGATSADGYPFGIVPARTANPDLQWEVATQLNIGLDFGLFNNRITGTFDYFNKVTTEVVLFSDRVDPIQPTEKIWTNVPDLEIRNAGLELALDYNTQIGEDFFINLGGNITYIDNEIRNSPFQILTTGQAQGSGQTGATIKRFFERRTGQFILYERISQHRS